MVCANDVELPLAPGVGLVFLPYQYHHYIRADRRLHWLFITFEYAQGVTIETLRNKAFPVGAKLAGEFEGILSAHRDLADQGLPELRLALVLSELIPFRFLKYNNPAFWGSPRRLFYAPT